MLNSLPVSLLFPGDDSGGGGYVAPAVHFDGLTQINRDDPLSGVSDGRYGLLSMWVNGADIFNNDLGSLFQIGGKVLLVQWDTTPQVPYLKLTSADGSWYCGWVDQTNSVRIPADTWSNLIFSWDFQRFVEEGGYGYVQFFLNDVDRTSEGSQLDNSDPSATIGYSGRPSGGLTAGNFTDSGPLNGRGPVCDASDLQFFITDTFVDLTVVENRRKLIDELGKPVDPAVAAAAFGPPIVLLSGDTATFATNQGTGGAYEVDGGYLSDTITEAGPTSISLPGVRVGQSVRLVTRSTTGFLGNQNIAANFESTITVDDQIQQSSEDDYTGRVILVSISNNNTLTDASTSPSD